MFFKQHTPIKIFKPKLVDTLYHKNVNSSSKKHIFEPKKTNNPRRTESPGSDCGGYFDDTNYKLRGKERARFKEMLEDLLSAVPDTLTVDDVAELTGYNRTTILRYVRKKYIYAVNIMGKYYISKQSIINYLATR